MALEPYKWVSSMVSQPNVPHGVPLDAPRGAFGAPLAAHLLLTCCMHEHNIT